MCPGETKALFPSPAQGPVQIDISLLLQDYSLMQFSEFFPLEM